VGREDVEGVPRGEGIGEERRSGVDGEGGGGVGGDSEGAARAGPGAEPREMGLRGELGVGPRGVLALEDLEGGRGDCQAGDGAAKDRGTGERDAESAEGRGIGGGGREGGAEVADRFGGNVGRGGRCRM
jgi:hypothetical protein